MEHKRRTPDLKSLLSDLTEIFPNNVLVTPKTEEIELPRTVRSIFANERVETMMLIGEQMGIEVKVLAREGEQYTAHSGYTGTVREGSSFVQIDPGEHENLSEYCRQVDAALEKKES